MTDVFNRILNVDVPETLQCDDSGKNPVFSIRFTTDGPVPFPQIILHTADAVSYTHLDVYKRQLQGLLEAAGWRILTAKRTPPNDGGLSLGQAWVAIQASVVQG